MKKLLLAGCISILLTASVLGDDSIQLPSGTVVKPASFVVRPKWKESFPEGSPFYAEKYPSGHLLGMYGRDSSKLEGAFASLHENGSLKILGAYANSLREGPYRVWDADKQMLLYSQYKENKKHGITCLFKNGVPWLIQEWKTGNMTSEAVFTSSKKKGWKSVEDPEQLADAKKKLSDIEETLKETDIDAKKHLREWFREEDERIRMQNVKIIRPVQKAEAEAREEAKRKESAEAARAGAAAVAGRHPYNPYHPSGANNRVRGAAIATRNAYARESNSAGSDLKAANKNANATANEAKNVLQKRDASIKEEYKDLYQFAMKMLDKSL